MVVARPPRAAAVTIKAPRFSTKNPSTQPMIIVRSGIVSASLMIDASSSETYGFAPTARTIATQTNHGRNWTYRLPPRPRLRRAAAVGAARGLALRLSPGRADRLPCEMASLQGSAGIASMMRLGWLDQNARAIPNGIRAKTPRSNLCTGTLRLKG